MELKFTEQGLDDYNYWLLRNKTIVKKIDKLINNTLKTPFQGLGKPEPLKYELYGKWSRRITQEHRLVYSVENSVITVFQCRFHY